MDDCGTVINPLLAEGQVHGGVAQGIAQAYTKSLAMTRMARPQPQRLLITLCQGRPTYPHTYLAE
ncbi:MAG: hypothetical protein Ct9H90mP5_10310 [Acidimicrobiaceae bacterium]|nr:MAG: hypothetical protein Ct9H90mP5_10310 [Acidimicrobiaceae bacterium]